MNVLILARSSKSYSTERIASEARKRGHGVTILSPSDFYLHTSEKVNGYDKIYVKSKRVFKKDTDVIIPRIGGSLKYGAAVVRHWMDNLSKPSTASADGLLTASDKWKTTQVLSTARIRVPKTTLIQRPEDFGFLVKSVGGIPCVAKLLQGSQGKGVFILDSEIGGSTALQTIANQRGTVLLQQYIETSQDDDRKSDLRVWVVGDRVVSAYRRFSLHKDFRSNYSMSKNGEEVELTEEEKTLAVNAAQAIGLGCAGVDIVRDTNDENKPYVIEINGNASLKGIETVTGDNIAIEIVKYAERISNNAGKNKSELSAPVDLEPIYCETTRRAMKVK